MNGLPVYWITDYRAGQAETIVPCGITRCTHWTLNNKEWHNYTGGTRRAGAGGNVIDLGITRCSVYYANIICYLSITTRCVLLFYNSVFLPLIDADLVHNSLSYVCAQVVLLTITKITYLIILCYLLPINYTKQNTKMFILSLTKEAK